jgi:predicted dehydrogenase
MAKQSTAPLRAIVAGAGSRGNDWIREIIAAPGFELAGCADVDAGILKATATRHGISAELCFSSIGEALDATGATALIIATPADAHEEPVTAALDRGIPALVEKPFATSLAAARSMTEFAEAKEVPLLVAQNYREMRAWRTVRRLIRSGRLGPVHQIAGHYYRVPHGMSSSLARLEHSVLWGVAMHHLDAIRHLLEAPATGVLCEFFRAKPASPNGASMNALITFDDSTRLEYSASYESSGHEYFERGQGLHFRFIGEHATLHMFHRWLFLAEGHKLPRPIFRGKRKVTEERLLLDELRDVIATGRASEYSARENLGTMAIVEACIRSSSERRWIDPRELTRE